MIWRSGDLEIERKIEEIRVIREDKVVSCSESIRGEKKVFCGFRVLVAEKEGG
jgi:hypothetical protein